MTETLVITPNPIEPSKNLRITGAEFDPTKKVQLALDGAGWTSNYFRPAADGTFHDGMNVGSAEKTQMVTARYAGSSKVIASVSVTVKKTPVDQPPVLSGITTTPTDNSITVGWHVSEPATGQVEYGATGAYGQTTPKESNLRTDHVQVITGLLPETAIHLRVVSIDSAGQATRSPDMVVSTKPGIPGPLPVGTTPNKAIRDTAAAGGDNTANVAAWIAGVPDKTLLDWDNLTIRLKQIMLENRALSFTGAGKLIFTAFMTGSAAGSIHMRNQCHDMSFNHLGPDGKPMLQMVGAAPASDYGRAHSSQEATENNHQFWLQGVQGIEIAGIIGYGFGGDSFYSGGWTAKGNQWTHNLWVRGNRFSAMGRMFGALADGGTNVLVEDNDFGIILPGTPIDSLAKAGPGWNGVIIEPNDAPVADGSAYGYANVTVRGNRFGRGYHPGGVSGGATNASARGGKPSTFAAPIRWEGNTSDPAFPWVFVNSYGAVVTQTGNK